MKSKFYILCILLFAGSFSPVIAQIDKKVGDISINYTPHGSIDIDADLDFIGYAFPGTGSSGDPYRIENYIISTSSTFGINIESVSSYFVILNCYIENQNDGIRIDSVDSGRTKIENTICINNNANGIDIVDSGEVTLIDNRLENNGDNGIYVEYCDGSTITNNTCVNNNDVGLHIRHSNTIEITESVCYDNNGFGIEIRDCTLPVIQHNAVYGNGNGITVLRSDFADISYNEIHDNLNLGIGVSTSEQVNVEHNICYNNGHGLEINGAGTSLINNNTCYDNKETGIEIRTSYYSTISFNNLTRNSLDIVEYMTGFYLVYTLQNNTINELPFGFLTHLENETITEDYGQLLLVNCTEVTIDSKEILSIKLYDSPNCSITNCTVLGGSTGILLRESEYTEITDNDISGSRTYGVAVSGSDGVVINYNTIHSSGWSGFIVTYSPNAEIRNNTISEVMSCAVSSSSSSRIINNTFTVELGLTIAGSINLEIKDNTFITGGFDFIYPREIIPYCDFGNNWVSGKPVGIYQNQADIIISQPHGQVYLINCDRVVLENQNIGAVPIGIFLAFGESCTIQNNIVNGASSAMLITNSTYTNIVSNDINSAFEGMVIRSSLNTLITQNTIENSLWQGINVEWESDSCLITHNTISNSAKHGLGVSSNNNIIHHNNFIGNHISHSYGTSQASDGGIGNQWYDASKNEGNFWDDWSGSGAYSIDGGSEDPFPLSSQAPITIPEFSRNVWFYFLISILSFATIPVLRYRRR